ncbi:MAG TPA: zinc ribbon domain-containing protein [Burkholderiales bacterium]|nr:zinc ribbon domain-containing protein [Burkholderiales bacterium]
MPIYEYRCSACGHQEEVLQKVSDAPLKRCPKCGKSALQKMVTAAGFQLKGTGWYATDFKGGAKSKPEASDGGKSKDDAKSAKSDDSPKSDAKPKTETQPKGESKPKQEAKFDASGGPIASPACS